MGAPNTFHITTRDGIQDEPKHISIECECTYKPSLKPLPQIVRPERPFGENIWLDPFRWPLKMGFCKGYLTGDIFPGKL